jgi:ribose transport system substrate-binding protein
MKSFCLSVVMFMLILTVIAGVTFAAEGSPPHVAVIVKALEPDFWQYVLIGANNYAVTYPDRVQLTTHGPVTEADIDGQIEMVEEVIASNPAAIVLAPSSTDALVPVAEKAIELGIPVIVIDSKLNTDKVTTLLATDNVLGGQLAAEEMVKFLLANDTLLQGKVAIVNSVKGVSTVMERNQGFIEKMKKLAPDIEILEPRYTDNDILKALATAEELIATYGDELLGIFAVNDHTGVGVAEAVKKQGLQDTVMVVAFDADPDELEALRAGALKALIVQDPFGMGYKGIHHALKAIEGESIPKLVDTGVAVVTQENMDDREIETYYNPILKEQ